MATSVSSAARLVGALVGVVVLATGCGTAAASDGAAAAAADATASPSGAAQTGPGCTCGPTSAAAGLATAHVGDLDLAGGYALASESSLDGTTTAAYVTISNAGLKPADLVGASSSKATSVELDATPPSGSNAEAVTAVDSIRIPAGGLVTLAPGGFHLMVEGLAAPLRIGDTLPLTLRFSGGRVARLTLPVEGR